MADKEQAWPEVMNGDSYLHTDNDVHCFNEDDNLEDDIVETDLTKQSCLEDTSEDKENDPDNETGVKITHTAARHSVQVLHNTLLNIASAMPIMLP